MNGNDILDDSGIGLDLGFVSSASKDQVGSRQRVRESARRRA
jgi:hypothetical protein